MSPRQTTTAVDLGGQGAEAGAREVLRPSCVVGVGGEPDLEPAQGLADLVLLVAEHDHDRRRARGEGGLDHVPDHGLAADRQEQLVGAAHAARLAGGEHQRRHLAGGCLGGRRLRLARLRPEGISISSPPTPMRMMSRPVTSMPAASRCRTQSKPLSLGERQQPGSPRTGRSPSRARSSRLPGSTGMPNARSCRPRPRSRPAARRRGR